jgi:tryptophanyl-tRNA synthetase
MRILSGVQSSGRLHLGNYYGAIREFVRLQNEGEALYFIANLHALNTVRDGETARRLTFETAVAFLALGVDPAKSILFRQSDVPEVLELTWIMGTLVPMANLERAHSYRDKLENKKVSPNFGLFAYPVLMAADILAYDADVVPVGKDQKQHVEFTRDWAQKFNIEFVKGYDAQDPTGGKSGKPGLLKLPEARIREATAVVPGIDGQKMSKSYGNTVDLFGPIKPIEKALKSIKTDSTAVEAPKPTEGQPLYELLQVMLPAEEFAAADQAWRAGGKGYGHFKELLLAAYHATFDGPRQRYEALSADPVEVERLLVAGAQRARACAAPVLERVREAVGL